MFTPNDFAYGSHRMASYLNKKEIKTHNDRHFTSSYILRIMKNEIYRGFLSKGGVKSERLEDLQIVPDKVFFQVQNILEQRNVKNDEKRQIALTNRGKALLSGNIYCGHCGSRLATSRGFIRYTRADGSQRSDSRGRYVCYHRSRGLNDCDGASVYDSERIDRAVLKAMSQIFASISGCPEEEKIEQAQRKVTAEFSHQKKRLEDQIRKDTKQLESLRSEIVKALAGESDFSGEDLATALRTLREKLDAETKELEKLKAEEADEKRTNDTSASGATRTAPAFRPSQPFPATRVCPKPPSSAPSKTSPPPAGCKKNPVSEETGQGAAICIS